MRVLMPLPRQPRLRLTFFLLLARTVANNVFCPRLRKKLRAFFSRLSMHRDVRRRRKRKKAHPQILFSKFPTPKHNGPDSFNKNRDRHTTFRSLSFTHRAFHLVRHQRARASSGFDRGSQSPRPSRRSPIRAPSECRPDVRSSHRQTPCRPRRRTSSGAPRQ